MNMNLSRLQEIVEDRGAWHAVVRGVANELDTTYGLNNSKCQHQAWLPPGSLSLGLALSSLLQTLHAFPVAYSHK